MQFNNGKRVKPKTKKVTKKGIQKSLAEARKILKSQAKYNSICSYVKVVNDNGKLKLEKHINDICHARMGAPYNKEVLELVDYLGSPKERFSKKQYKEYLRFADYIINRSWISSAFIPTTVQNYIRNGVRINVEAEATEVFAGLISLRQGSEKKNKILPIFTPLVEKGYKEDLAFLMSLLFFRRGKEYTIHIPMGHSPIAENCDKEKILNIARGEVKFKRKDPYRKISTDWGLFRFFGIDAEQDKENIGGYLKSIVSNYVPEQRVWGELEINTPLTEEVFLKVVDDIAKDIGVAK